jgi:FKBP-type peptidyl-prolyl cis-trans isomerase SlpA
MAGTVEANSLLTLHYRIALADDTELLSTFGATPATLQLGGGELAPTLERCLHGLPEGERHVFLLEPHQAFGEYHPELVLRQARATLPAEPELEVMSMIEFAAPDGSKHAGLVRELDEAFALVDLNHPLAGKNIRFEVEVIGIL